MTWRGSGAPVRCFATGEARIARALALDEIVLEDIGARPGEAWVHIWRPAETAVVLGSACKLSTEVSVDACRRREIPVFRRITGGGTVVLSPETWCYSFAWHRSLEPGTIGAAFALVCEPVIAALGRLGVAALSEPISDIAAEVAGRGLCKLAGHGQKRRRAGTLCGGSLLARPFPFPVGEILRHPPREPPYRRGRSHDEFMANLAEVGIRADFTEFAAVLGEIVGTAAAPAFDAALLARAEDLARAKYLDPVWTERL